MCINIYMTSNLRNWFQFLALRMDSHAQAENRLIARKVFKELAVLFPISSGVLARAMFTDSALIDLGMMKQNEIIKIKVTEGQWSEVISQFEDPIVNDLKKIFAVTA